MPDAPHLEPQERRHLLGHRWWTVDELAETSDPVYPFGLASLVGELLAGRVPPEPVRLAWHHRPRRRAYRLARHRFPRRAWRRQ